MKFPFVLHLKLSQDAADENMDFPAVVSFEIHLDFSLNSYFSCESINHSKLPHYNAGWGSFYWAVWLGFYFFFRKLIFPPSQGTKLELNLKPIFSSFLLPSCTIMFILVAPTDIRYKIFIIILPEKISGTKMWTK